MAPEGAPTKPAANWVSRLLLAAVIVLVVLLVLWLGRRAVRPGDHFTIEDTRPVVSQVDDMQYRVQPDLSQAEEAANRIAEINGKLIEVMRWLKQKYLGSTGPRNDGKTWGDLYPERAAAVRRILRRYNPDNFVENSPRDPANDTSYVVDKGSIFALCLRSKGNGYKLLDMTTLMFVALHELTHIAVEVIDHPPEFWRAFKFILQEAWESGIYRSPDFGAHPVDYCGLAVNYSPLYDDATEPI